MKPKWRRRWRVLSLGIDTTAVVIALGGAALFRVAALQQFEYASPGLTLRVALTHVAVAVPVWIGAFAISGLYEYVRCMSSVEQARRLVAAGLAAPIAFVTIAFALKQEPSRLWLALGTLLVIPLVGAERRALHSALRRFRMRGKWQTPVVVVGRREAKALVEKLLLDSSSGLLPVATCGFSWDGLPEGAHSHLAALVRAHSASSVLIVSADMERDEVNQAVAVADELPAEVLVLPGLSYTLAHNLAVVPVGDEPGLSLEPASLRVYQRLLKRTMDIAVSIAVLAVSWPALLMIGLLIRLDSPGRALFKQQRVGQLGRIFTLWKFRTMVDGADATAEEHVATDKGFGFTLKEPNDPRVTRIGRWLRRLSLDELPQLINVIRGEMSLVGPRPVTLRERHLSESVLTGRLLMPPGMTGLWQVNGRSAVSAEDRARLDLTYVRNWSLLLDLYILMRTIPATIARHGAY